MSTSVRLYVWPHRLVFVGPGFDTTLHRHHAAQICVALEGELRLRTAAGSRWQQAAGFFVPPDQPHRLDAGTHPLAVAYLEAEGAEYADYLGRMGFSCDAPVAIHHPRGAAAMALLATQGGTCEDAEAACRDLLGVPLLSSRSSGLDPRLEAALEWLQAHVRGPIRLADVARAVGLSASHFAHLFSARIGVPLRRYVLWLRLRAAIAEAMRGGDLTGAAHAAGFADSAHLSRTFKQTFGVTPSFLFATRDRVETHFYS